MKKLSLLVVIPIILGILLVFITLYLIKNKSPPGFSLEGFANTSASKSSVKAGSIATKCAAKTKKNKKSKNDDYMKRFNFPVKKSQLKDAGINLDAAVSAFPKKSKEQEVKDAIEIAKKARANADVLHSKALDAKINLKIGSSKAEKDNLTKLLKDLVSANMMLKAADTAVKGHSDEKILAEAIKKTCGTSLTGSCRKVTAAIAGTILSQGGSLEQIHIAALNALKASKESANADEILGYDKYAEKTPAMRGKCDNKIKKCSDEKAATQFLRKKLEPSSEAPSIGFIGQMIKKGIPVTLSSHDSRALAHKMDNIISNKKPVEKLKAVDSSLKNAQLPAHKIAELPISEIAKLPTAKIVTLPRQIIAQLPAKKIAEMPAHIIAKMPVNKLIDLPMQKLAELPAERLPELPTALLNKLMDYKLSLLTPAERAKLPKLVTDPAVKCEIDSMSKLPINKIAELPSAKIAMLSSNIIAKLPTNVIAKLPTYKIAELPKQVVAKLPLNIISHLPAYKISTLPHQIIAKLPAHVITVQPANIIAKMPAKVIAQLPTHKIAQLPAKIITQLPPKLIEKLPTAKIAELPAAKIATLPPKVINTLPIKVIAKQQPHIIAKLPLDKIVKLPTAAVTSLPSYVISKLPAAKLSTLPPVIVMSAKSAPKLETCDNPRNCPVSGLQTMFAKAGCTKRLTEADAKIWRGLNNLADVQKDMNTYGKLAKECMGDNRQNELCLPTKCPLEPKVFDTKCEGEFGTFKCPSGKIITGIKFKYGKWNKGSCPGANSRTKTVKYTEKVITPAACLNKESCTIKMDNALGGDPFAGTRKEWKAEVQCGGIPKPLPAPQPSPCGQPWWYYRQHSLPWFMRSFNPCGMPLSYTYRFR